jgi:hypothetical protein
MKRGEVYIEYTKEKMKKKIVGLLLVVFLMSGCSFNTTLSYTFNVETGDDIKVELITTDGYDMNKKTPIIFTKDDKEVARATFLFEEAYDQYYEAAQTDPNASMIEEDTKDDTEYFFYMYDEGETAQYNYFIMINDTKTGVLITGKDEDKVTECFENLTFTEE